MYELFIRLVGFPPGSFRVLWNELGFDKLVQFIQIQVGEDGTDHASHNVANFGHLFLRGAEVLEEED